MTLISIAEHAIGPDKISRNWKNAKDAYSAVRHFIDRTDLTGPEAAELHSELKNLERRLEALESIAEGI